mmetsp:Transcript_9185/g.13594  ORF Transcript_9185/g.13594 Transcript_9185/m.13594 type:complete len:255 (+) Transcript_9185:314-1078(+)
MIDAAHVEVMSARQDAQLITILKVRETNYALFILIVILAVDFSRLSRNHVPTFPDGGRHHVAIIASVDLRWQFMDGFDVQMSRCIASHLGNIHLINRPINPGLRKHIIKQKYIHVQMKPISIFIGYLRISTGGILILILIIRIRIQSGTGHGDRLGQMKAQIVMMMAIRQKQTRERIHGRACILQGTVTIRCRSSSIMAIIIAVILVVHGGQTCENPICQPVREPKDGVVRHRCLHYGNLITAISIIKFGRASQ